MSRPFARWWSALAPMALMALMAACGSLMSAEPALQRPARMVWFPRFSPDGEKLATAHGNWDQQAVGAVRVWDAATGKELFQCPTERGVRSVAWSPGGKVIAAGTYGKSICFFNAETGAEIGQMPLEANVEVVLFSPDEQRLITSFNSGSIIIWDLSNGRPIHNFHVVHKGGVWGLTQSQNGKLLASAGQDGFVRVYDLEQLKVLKELQHPAATNGVVFTVDGRHLLTGCEDSLIRVYDVATGQERAVLKGHQSGSVTDLQFTADGQRLASSGMDQTIRLWDMADLSQPSLLHTLKAHEKFAFGVAISHKDRWLASAGWDDQIHVWDLATLKETWSWKWTK